MIKFVSHFFILLLLVLSTKGWSREVPSLAGPVVDEAGILSSSVERSIESLIRQAHSSGGMQLQVLTIESLDGDAIEDFSMRVVEAWKLGGAKSDNGVLLLVSKNDRAVRIEVGQGLEGQLTDVQSSRIIRSVIVPEFRTGSFDQGIWRGVNAIFASAGVAGFEGAGDIAAEPRARKVGIRSHLGLIMFLLFFIFFIGRRGPGSRFRGGGWGGGGFGGFGGGLGGGSSWGGGGGGFSGGGASGRW